MRAAVAPPGSARPDFDIVLDVARHWGCGDLLAGWQGPRDAFEEWRRVSAGRPCDYSGISWERIDAAGGVQWPCPDQPVAPVPLAGTPRLYTDLRFNHPGGRAVVAAVEPRPLRDPPRPDYPLLLNTGRTVEHWHTRTKTGRIAVLEGLAPEAWVEVNPADAAAHRIRSGDWVRLTSARGTIDAVRARVTSIVREGEVFVPFHWEDRCANRLTDDEFDPISREPNYKQCAVRLTRLDLVGHPDQRRERWWRTIGRAFGPAIGSGARAAPASMRRPPATSPSRAGNTADMP